MTTISRIQIYYSDTPPHFEQEQKADKVVVEAVGKWERMRAQTMQPSIVTVAVTLEKDEFFGTRIEPSGRATMSIMENKRDLVSQYPKLVANAILQTNLIEVLRASGQYIAGILLSPEDELGDEEERPTPPPVAEPPINCKIELSLPKESLSLSNRSFLLTLTQSQNVLDAIQYHLSAPYRREPVVNTCCFSFWYFSRGTTRIGIE